MKKIDLLNAINKKKQQVIDLVNADKLDDAKAAKAELQTLQDKLDLLEDMDGSEGGENHLENVKNVSGSGNAIHDFAEAARHHFQNIASEGDKGSGGYTVPEDIQTRINKYKETKFSLKSLVKVENVTTMSGRRVFQKKTAHKGFANVSEAGKIGAKATPTFLPLDYNIKKYAGYLPVTNELLEDSDENISQVFIEWLGDEEVATENAQILELIQPKSTDTDFEDLDGIKTAVNVTLGQAYADSSSIVTNDDGFNHLDTLKNEDGDYLLKPAKDPSAPIPYELAVGARRIPVVVVPNEILTSEIFENDTYMPFIVGDLEEAVAYFDRQKLSIMTSNTAAVTIKNGDTEEMLSAFENDLTFFRGIMRLDVEARDNDAIVKGYIKK
jgi:HK97 family phage major capsid protein